MTELDDLFADQMSKEAKSSEVFKLEIYVCYARVLESARILREHKFMTNSFQKNEVDEFATWLSKLFDFMRFMIQEKMMENKSEKVKINEKRMFDDLKLLSTGSLNLSKTKVVYLFDLKDFILGYMHECRITDLFMKKKNPINEFENEY